ncbi:hypothetical protein ACFVWG_16110 [Kribbella sp. NPDC058245]|uniref:hypothetical protein n=1 Tax=Kribbella sp. NPDC058245 TaxID=3346399 RepID=UPI0036E18BE9
MIHLRWEEVENFFDPELMGALPDLWIPGSSVEDWQSVFDLVQSSEWTWTYRVGEEPSPCRPPRRYSHGPPMRRLLTYTSIRSRVCE